MFSFVFLNVSQPGYRCFVAAEREKGTTFVMLSLWGR